MKVNELKWSSLKDNLRKFQAVETRWLLWKRVWQADLVSLCVYLYTLSVYTHMIMLMHNLCVEKKILIFQFSSYFDVHFGNTTLFPPFIRIE